MFTVPLEELFLYSHSVIKCVYLQVNGASVEVLSLSEVVKHIQSSDQQLTLNVVKSSSRASSLFLSSPDSSGQLLLTSSGVSSPDVPDCSPPSEDLWQLTGDGNTKVVNTTIRSSGSQTDSLDSPPTSARNRTIPAAPPRSGGIYIKSGTAKESLLQRAKKLVRNKVVDRTDRCQSLVYDSSTVSEQSVIDEFSDIVNQYSQPENKPKSNRRQHATSTAMTKERNSGGTWPRCRPLLDEGEGENQTGFQPVIPRRGVKQRPPLPSEVMYQPPPIPSLPNPAHRMPPTPPERNDSFTRHPSIKHSPQSSDSTVKSVGSSSHRSGQPQGSSPVKLFQSTLQQQQPPNKQQTTQGTLSQGPSNRKMTLNLENNNNQGMTSSLLSSGPTVAHGYHQQLHSGGNSSASYGNGTGASTDVTARFNSTPPGGPAMFNSPPDFSVVSGDMSQYRRRPRTAPPPRNREEKQGEKRESSTIEQGSYSLRMASNNSQCILCLIL